MFEYRKLTPIRFVQKSMQERKEDGNKKRNMSKSPEDDDDDDNEMVRAFKSHVYKETTLTCLLSFDRLIVKNTMPSQRETKSQRWRRRLWRWRRRRRRRRDGCVATEDDDDDSEMVRAFKSHVYKETTLTCFLSFDQLIVKNTMPSQRETKSQRWRWRRQRRQDGRVATEEEEDVCP
jgi:hypothetical protein